MLAYCGADGTVFRFQVILIICWKLQLPAVPFLYSIAFMTNSQEFSDPTHYVEVELQLSTQGSMGLRIVNFLVQTKMAFAYVPPHSN